MKFALAGNPNCGKTTLFNELTGSTAHVGNWPGVTVDKREGVYKKLGDKVDIVDLPGIYSLSPYTPEEVVSRNFVIDEHPDCIINVIDATNLERNLYLTTQLLEVDAPMIIALNMMDVVKQSGTTILTKELEKKLGVPVVEISALKGEGIDELMKKAYYVPETITVDKLFEEMRKNKKQISIVIEEHGGTSGIVTMEDILEEIVGEIYDEYDALENKVVEIDSNTYLIDGSLAVYDLEKIFDVEIPEGDYDTISGYLIDLLGRIPKPKENIIIETDQLDFKVEKVKNKKIVQVKVCKK